MSQTATETLVVYSDYVCPFCFLGHESLDEYLAERSEPLETEWHPYDLRAGQRFVPQKTKGTDVIRVDD